MEVLSPVHFLFFGLLAVYTAAESPCLKYEDVNPKRYVTHNAKNFPLALGVSERLTHQLTAEVFKIFLNEVLGYPDVKIVRMKEANNPIDIVKQFYSEQVDRPPEIMIDLEGLVSLSDNLLHDLEDYKVKECGIVGPPVRFGWYTPTDALIKRTNSTNLLYDTFKNEFSAKAFSLLKEDIDELRSKKVIVDEFAPEWCRTSNDCSTLIASSPKPTQFVKDDIQQMRLYVQVLWVGKQFRPVTVDLLEKYSNSVDPLRSTFLILGQSLELLLFKQKFTAVMFPPCNYYSEAQTCNYMGQRMVKLAWDELISAATPAYDALQKVEFKSTDYQEMVALYLKIEHTDPKPIFSTACQWMKNHESKNKTNPDSWTWWKPMDEVELSLVGIFPLSRPVFSSLGIYSGARMAIDEVNEIHLPSNYKLKLLLEDGQCKADMVMRTYIKFIVSKFRKVVGILGPACSETIEPLAGVATHFNTVVISYSAQGSSFSDRKKYPYFFRTIGENGQYKYVYQELFKKFGWKRVASLSEDGTRYTEYVSQTQDLLLKDGVSFVASKKFGPTWSDEPEKVKEYLLEFKSKEARIIIADVNEAAAKALMCEAFHLNMTAKSGFVWFLPSWLMPFWLESDLSHNVASQGRNCTAQQMTEAIDAHLSLSHAFFADDNATIHTNKTVKEWKEGYQAKLLYYNTTASDYAGYAYDAVWVYAKALSALINENETYISNLHSENVTQRYVEFIQNSNFSGVTGQIVFNGGPTRNSTKVNVFQWNSFNSSQQQSHRVLVGTYDPVATDSSRFILNNKIRWLTEGGRIPWDGTLEGTCIVDGLAKFLNAECQTALVVANIIVFGFILLLVLVGFLVIKHKYDKKVQATREIIKILGIDPTPYSLDKWEISKDRVVINRKLGEGAFGMVYGGETYFNEKGWVAVAVKTLKVGSTTEEKLDFLSEAEVMKRFDHKNIIQLLGVCTKNEPVYTIMEFMLYGDLKTFLLARRHLANDSQREDNDDISSKRLTNMASDVARALGYLAENKYVHRDVASRNCLVNASRAVKLGDFGMTRSMCDNDYYKFNRKGMLPVRWMSPESLALGKFSPASDIWSYGVLLYEIITFGNFPFQGMTNTEVLDYVKEGNTLSIPRGVKANLEGLIRSCWSIDPRKRPLASEIVDFLGNCPRIITPCLDVPLSSVPPMEDNSFGMTFDEGKTRKHSVTLRQRISSSPSSDIRPWTDVSQPLLSSPTDWYKSAGSNSISENTELSQNITFPL